MEKIKIIFIFSIIAIIFVLFLVFDIGRKNNEIAFIDESNSTSSFPIDLNIKDGQTVSNPIKIEGKARGYWFFEGSFPIKLVSTNNEILGTALGQSKTDWMAEDFVDFSADLEYIKSTSTNRALLILSKDNPSGNKELDQEIYIPVIIK
jgi:hypothetical protein